MPSGTAPFDAAGYQHEPRCRGWWTLSTSVRRPYLKSTLEMLIPDR